MEGLHILSAICLILALASSFSSAYDTNPLQDFCVAINGDIKDGVFVNGKFCKDPKLVKAEDFYYSGLNIAKNTTNLFGAMVTPVTVNQLPGLNTLGLSVARVDVAPNGSLIPPHVHPRASEINIVSEGTLYAGFVTSEPENRLITKVLNPGDVFVFPIGLIHFLFNIGKTPAVVYTALNSQNPGLIIVANANFGSNPRIDPEVLAKAFQLDINIVKNLQSKYPNK